MLENPVSLLLEMRCQLKFVSGLLLCSMAGFKNSGSSQGRVDSQPKDWTKWGTTHNNAFHC